MPRKPQSLHLPAPLPLHTTGDCSLPTEPIISADFARACPRNTGRMCFCIDKYACTPLAEYIEDQGVTPAPDEVSLSEDDKDRAMMPMADGLLDYFPNALAYVAMISKLGSDKHNPGQDMHWARDKSTDHANKIMRHLVDRGRLDSAGVRHSGNLAWRALANLQVELEEAGAPRSRASR